MATAKQLRRESVLEIVKKHGYGRKASILPDSGIVYEKADVAPSPSRDYCQVLVTRKEVILRTWKISSRNDAKVSPSQIRDTYEEFMDDDQIQSEMHRVFGKSMVDYVKNLCRGQIDYLPRLPLSVLRSIVDYLSLEDLAKLSCVSKQFRKVSQQNFSCVQFIFFSNGLVDEISPSTGSPLIPLTVYI